MTSNEDSRVLLQILLVHRSDPMRYHALPGTLHSLKERQNRTSNFLNSYSQSDIQNFAYSKKATATTLLNDSLKSQMNAI